MSLVILTFYSGFVFAVGKKVITATNEFGGQTIEISNEDYSKVRTYYDEDGAKAKEETIFTSEYPIYEGLKMRISHYFFDRKVKEERVFTDRVAHETLVRRTIDYYDRHAKCEKSFDNCKIKTENRFVEPYSEYNVIYRKKGAKTRIEWYYPNAVEGIAKNVMYFDDFGRAIRIESFYTDKSTTDQGFYKRICYNEYNEFGFFRKKRQEWYYTDDYALANNGKVKKIQHYYYRSGEAVRVETNYLNNEGKRILDSLQ